MRLSLMTSACVLVVALLLAPPSVAADPLLISVISASYTTELDYRANMRVVDEEGNSGLVSDAKTQVTTSNAPLFEALVREMDTWASAKADLFYVEGYASAHIQPDAYGGTANGIGRSVVQFTPLESRDASIGLDFVTFDLGWFGSGSTSLIDLTTNEVLWDYRYIRNYVGNVPFPDEGSTKSASLSMQHAFDATHAYQLTLWTRGNAADDSNGSSIAVTGFHAVPEPSTLLLFGPALVGMRVWQLRRTRRQTRLPSGNGARN